MFSLICACINGWVNYGGTGDLRRHRAHYYATIMCMYAFILQVSKLWSVQEKIQELSLCLVGNHTYCFVCDVMNHRCPNFNSVLAGLIAVEGRAWMSNCTSAFYVGVITCPWPNVSVGLAGCIRSNRSQYTWLPLGRAGLVSPQVNWKINMPNLYYDIPHVWLIYSYKINWVQQCLSQRAF